MHTSGSEVLTGAQPCSASSNDPIAVFCSNGFKSFNDDASTEDEGNSIFVISLKYDKLVNLIFHPSNTRTGEVDAELVISPKVGEIHRLAGECDIVTPGF